MVNIVIGCFKSTNDKTNLLYTNSYVILQSKLQLLNKLAQTKRYN